MNIGQVFNLFLQYGEETDDQMEILEAQPLPFLCGFSQHFKSCHVLISSHWHLFVVFSPNNVFRMLLELFWWVKSWRDDEQCWCLFLNDVGCQLFEIERHSVNSIELKHSLAEFRERRNGPFRPASLDNEASYKLIDPFRELILAVWCVVPVLPSSTIEI